METEDQKKTEPRKRKRGKLTDADKLIRDLNAGFKANRKLLEQSLAQCSPGTNSYLAHIKALDDQFLKYSEFRREIGVLPKNVGTITEKEFIFKAHASKGGAVNTTRISTPAQMQEIERAEAKEIKKGQYLSAEDEAIRAGFDEQFSVGAAQSEGE